MVLFVSFKTFSPHLHSFICSPWTEEGLALVLNVILNSDKFPFQVNYSFNELTLPI